MNILKKIQKMCTIFILGFIMFSAIFTVPSSLFASNPSYNDTGVLLINFGEPESMEEGYEGWTNFLKNYMGSMISMMKMGFIVETAKEMTDYFENGTLLLDKDNPFSSKQSDNPNLVDAWGKPYYGNDYTFIPRPAEALFETLFMIPQMGDLAEFIVDMSGGMPSVYFVADSSELGNTPGKGYSNAWEYLSLTMYPMYEAMGDKNPALERELWALDEVESKLSVNYPGLHISRGFGAARPGYPHFLDAAEALVKNNNIKKLILAPNYVVYSDFENPAGEIKHDLLKKGHDIEIVITDQIGGAEDFNKGIAEHIYDELEGNINIGNAPIDSDKNVMVFLSHHGMMSTNMLLYDFGKEPYHEFAREAYDAAVSQIEELDEVKSWEGKFGALQIYPEMATGILDPFNKYLNIDEGMKIAKAQGYDYIINVPYEVGNSGFETLGGLRGAWGIEPKWDTYEEDNGLGTLMRKYRNTFLKDGINVIITDGWINGQIDSYYTRIQEAVQGL